MSVDGEEQKHVDGGQQQQSAEQPPFLHPPQPGAQDDGNCGRCGTHDEHAQQQRPAGQFLDGPRCDRSGEPEHQQCEPTELQPETDPGGNPTTSATHNGTPDKCRSFRGRLYRVFRWGRRFQRAA